MNDTLNKSMKLYSLVLGQLGTNCYIWADEETKNSIVIDAPDCADKIIEFADGKGLKITDIILTHGHFDHMLALAELKAATGARLSIFEKTERFLEDRVLNLCHYMGIELSPTKADNILYDGDIINFGENRIKVIATPGHTEDCICLLCGKNADKRRYAFQVERRQVGSPDRKYERGNRVDTKQTYDA